MKRDSTNAAIVNTDLYKIYWAAKPPCFIPISNYTIKISRHNDTFMRVETRGVPYDTDMPEKSLTSLLKPEG
jgi:hypothetical protein